MTGSHRLPHIEDLSADTSRRLLRAGAAGGLAGVVCGVLWAALVPTGLVVPQPGYEYSLNHPELVARQDGVFIALAATAGFAQAVWLLVRSDRRLILAVGLGAFTAIAGSVVAWITGMLVGPLQPAEAMAGYTAEQLTQAVPASLNVHAMGALFVWPTVFCVVMSFGMFAVNAWSVWGPHRSAKKRRRRRAHRGAVVSCGQGKNNPATQSWDEN